VLLALDPKASAALELEQSAMMTATGCMVYSNSKNPGGLQAKDSGHAQGRPCLHSGWQSKTAGATVTPDPVTDCPVMADPCVPHPAVRYGLPFTTRSSVASCRRCSREVYAAD